MNGKEFWAQEYAKAYLDDDHESARTDAYVEGVNKGLEMAASMVESFENPKTRGIAVLIRAIGRAEVDKNTGRRIVDIEDEERLPS